MKEWLKSSGRDAGRAGDGNDDRRPGRALFVPYRDRIQGNRSDINRHEGFRTKAMNTA